MNYGSAAAAAAQMAPSAALYGRYDMSGYMNGAGSGYSAASMNPMSASAYSSMGSSASPMSGTGSSSLSLKSDSSSGHSGNSPPGSLAAVAAAVGRRPCNSNDLRDMISMYLPPGAAAAQGQNGHGHGLDQAGGHHSAAAAAAGNAMHQHYQSQMLGAAALGAAEHGGMHL